jgi:hypothetical protein
VAITESLAGVTVNDEVFVSAADIASNTTSAFDGTLTPGETVFFSGTYTVTIADALSGTVNNEVTVTSDDLDGDPITDGDTETTPIVKPETNPSIEVDKYLWDVNGSPDLSVDVVAGDELLYAFEVTNTGDVTLSDVELTDALPGVMIDEQIYSWHREAAGYKIRHVPARLPDMLKTHDMLRWEYEPHLGLTTDQAIRSSQERLDWMSTSRSDYEIALPLFELASFVRCEGYYQGLPTDVRDAQIARLLQLHDELYPKLRIVLFDARELLSAPITVFGPLMAVLYIGQHYLTFRDTDRVDAFTRHFDRLVREAFVTSHDFPEHLRGLTIR